jgi:hypothetical protein
LLRKAAIQHAKLIPTVLVCQEYPGQLHSAWAPFAASLSRFREPIQHRELVPMVASPYIRPGWEPKKKKPPGRPGMRAPLSARADAVLGSVGRAIAC